MRRFFGVLLGTIFGLGAIAGFLWLNHYLFPWPAFDLHDPASIGAMIASAPMTVRAMIVGGWFLGTLVGGLIAVRAAGWATAGWIVSVLIALAGIYQVIEIPHPLWMQIAAVIAPFAAGLVVSGASGAA